MAGRILRNNAGEQIPPLQHVRNILTGLMWLAKFFSWGQKINNIGVLIVVEKGQDLRPLKVAAR